MAPRPPAGLLMGPSPTKARPKPPLRTTAGILHRTLSAATAKSRLEEAGLMTSHPRKTAPCPFKQGPKAAQQTK